MFTCTSKQIEGRDFEITIISACGLESVRRRKHGMQVYAKVSLGAKRATEKQTPVDKNGDANPTWNFPMKYTIEDEAVHRHGVMLGIKLYCRRAHLRKDKYIGEVNLHIKDLFVHDSDFFSGFRTEPVRRGCKISEGSLNFSYSLK